MDDNTENVREDDSYILDGINNNTYNLFFGDDENLPEERWGDLQKYMAWRTISHFTMFTDDISMEEIQSMSDEKLLLNYKFITKKDDITYKYDDGTQMYEFIKMSDYYLSDNLKKELQSEERYGKCGKAVDICDVTKNSNVIFGYYTAGPQKISHFIIEYAGGKNLYVGDYTMNAIMPKKQYYELTAFEEQGKVSHDDLINDYKTRTPPYLSDKVYVAFRNEIMNEIKSKPSIFGKSESGTKLYEKLKKLSEEKEIE